MKLSLIIPVYNEANTLSEIWQILHHVVWPCDVEYVLVDDGSTDGSRDIAKSLVSSGDQLILQEENQGKTAAIREGISAARGDMLVVQDADLEYDPSDLLRMMKPIMEDKADVVYGSRYKHSGDQIQRTYHRLGIKALTYFSNLCTGVYLTDLEGCYKLFRADLLKNTVIESSGFDFEPEITCKISKLRLRMQEMQISYTPRSYLEGKKIRLRDGFSALWTIVRFSFLTPFARCFKPGLPQKYLRTYQKLP